MAVLLLLFNSIGALYGGWHLMLHPDGSSIQLSPNWLEHTPFDTYFIPGLILFVANGLLSLFVAVSIFFQLKHYYLFIILQGSVLLGWICVQIWMIQTIYFLHYIMGGVGLLLMAVGFLTHYFSRGRSASMGLSGKQKVT